jgi:hypothetical protein
MSRRIRARPPIAAWLVVALVGAMAGPASADEADCSDTAPGDCAPVERIERVYPYEDAVYYYWLDHGFVFEHPRVARAGGSLELTAQGPESGAVAIDARRGRVGVAATAARFSPPDAMSVWKASGGDGLAPRLDMWSVAATVAVIDTASWYVGGIGGVGGLDSNEHTIGPVAGVRAVGALSQALDVIATVRGYGLGSDHRAVETAVGVRAWLLRAGYRVVRAESATVGGPEVGIVVRW